MPVKLNSSGGGSVTLTTPSTASDFTLTVPAVTGSALVSTSGSSTSSTGIDFPSANTVSIKTNGTTAVTVDSSQNVGIGTASPTAKLNVSTTTAFSFSAPSTAGVEFGDRGTGAGYIFNIPSLSSGFNSGLAIDGSYSSQISTVNIKAFGVSSAGGYVSNLTFHTSSGTTLSERARIDSSGNLLVGTTSAINSGKLSISNGTNRAIVTAGSTGDVGVEGIRIQKFDNNSTTSQLFVRFTIANDGSGSGQINANGASAAAFGSYSDERLKENIVELPNQLANICALKPSEFDFKDGSGHQIGFIAQEMQEVYPDVVGEGDDGMLTITGWSKTEARLVKAIQELSAKLDAAEARIAALEGAK
jgi:hypothetical protein